MNIVSKFGLILLMVLLFLVSSATAFDSSSSSNYHIVSMDGNGDYSTIQQAINNASSGDTIKVKSGYYSENVVVNKSLSLIGEKEQSFPTIDAGGTGSAIFIISDNCTIKYFNITGSGDDFSSGASDSGILVKSNNNNITNNIVYSNNYGIYVFENDYNHITNNRISDNKIGIYSLYANNNFLDSNQLKSNDEYGIFISNSNKTTVTNSTIFLSSKGIKTYNSADSSITNNIAKDNSIGFEVESSTLINNTATGNSNYGFNSKYSTLINNIAENNLAGFKIESSTLINNTAIGNTGSNFGYGFSSKSSTLSNNTAKHNLIGFYGESSILNDNIAFANSNYGFSVSSSELTNNNATMNSRGYYLNENNLLIKNKALKNNYYGIYSNNVGNLIFNCTISNNGPDSLGSGIFSYHPIVIIGNDIFGNSKGIDLIDSRNIISENQISNNTGDGIHLLRDSNEIYKNHILENGENGIYLKGDSNSIKNNMISNNSNNGLFLSYSDNNLISQNIIDYNGEFGVEISRSSNTRLNENEIKENNKGLIVADENSDSSTFQNNSFISNSEYNVFDSSGLNLWKYNYYSDYNGLDSNNDGYGDTPYYIEGNLLGLRDEYPSMQPYNVQIPDISTLRTDYSGASFILSPGESINLGHNSIKLRDIDVTYTKIWFEYRGVESSDKIVSVGEHFVITDSWNDRLIFRGYVNEISENTGEVTFTSFYQIRPEIILSSSDLQSIKKSAPTVSEVTVGEITHESAAIKFDVDQVDAKTEVRYGTNESLANYESKWDNSTDSTSRQISLTDLDDNTKYYYEVFAYNKVNESFNNSSGINDFNTRSVSGNRILQEGMALHYVWDGRSFSGFYYDLDTSVSSERMSIDLSEGSRNVADGNLRYITEPVITEFDYGGFGEYQVIGFMADRYFAGYTAATTAFVNRDISMMADGQLSKVLIDTDDRRSVFTGSSLVLEDGYEIDIVEIDVSGDSVFLTLKKNGTEVDSATLSSGDIYVYERDIGHTDDVPVIAAHISSVFRETEANAVFIEGIFQISDDYVSIEQGEKFGRMEISSISENSIEMRNNGSFNLRQGTTIDIMGDLKFIVADSGTIRFAPFVDITESGVHEIRGTVAENEGLTWTPLNFEGFYYDIDEGLMTESLELEYSGRYVGNGDLRYETVPALVSFEKSDFGSYEAIGFMAEKYFAGYTAATTAFVNRDISMMADGQLSKVLLDNDNRRNLYTGSSLVLEEGYVLRIQEIDLDGNNVLVSLTKDGSEVDSYAIVGAGQNYIYERDIGSTDDVPIIIVNIEDIIKDDEDVIIGGIFQISDVYQLIETGDKFGKMEVDSIIENRIVMTNDGGFSLSRGSTIDIMGDIKFKVADSSDIRYYPFINQDLDVESEPKPDKPMIASDIVHNITIEKQTPKFNFTTQNDESSWTYKIIDSFKDPYYVFDNGKFTKILIDNDETWDLEVGQSLSLAGGYAITPLQIDVDGEKVWIELTKDGTYIDDIIIDIGQNIDAYDKTWRYKQDIDGNADIVTLMVHVDEISTGNTNHVLINGIFQISKEIILIPDEFMLKNETIVESINSGDLVYNATVIDNKKPKFNFKTENNLDSWTYNTKDLFSEKYYVFGEGNYSQILIDSSDRWTLRVGQTFELKEGYAITPLQIDVDGNKIWLELTKNGQYVSDEIIDASLSTFDRTWIYKQDVMGEDDIGTLYIHVDQVFLGTVDSLCVIEGIFQISDELIQIEEGDDFSKMVVKQVTSDFIKMENNETILIPDNDVSKITQNTWIRGNKGSTAWYIYTNLSEDKKITPVEPDIEPEPEPVAEVDEVTLVQGDAYQINNYLIDARLITASGQTASFDVYEREEKIKSSMISVNESFTFGFEDDSEVKVELVKVDSSSGLLDRATIAISISGYSLRDLHTTEKIPYGDDPKFTDSIYTINLSQGWNLISTPQLPADPSIDSIFGNYDDILQPVYAWDPVSKQYYEPEKLELGKGYWVFALNKTDVEIK